MSEALRWDQRTPRWMWEGRPVQFGYDAAMNPSGVNTSDAIVAMMQIANLADPEWIAKTVAELQLKPKRGTSSLPLRPQPASSLKSPLAIRQVHPEVRWG